MTPLAITNLIRRKTRSTSATFSDTDILVDVNTFKDEIASRIQQIRPEIWNIPAVDDLVLNQREYAFPNDVINNLVSLELKFGIGADDKYIKATPLKRLPTGIALEQESTITDNYTNDNPFYFVRRNAVFILSGSIVAVTDGLNLVYNAFPANLTDLASSIDMSSDPTTTTSGFPREFHELLARRVSIHYKDLNDIKLSREDQLYEQDLEKALEDFSTAIQDLQEIAQMPSSQSMSGHGFNL